MSRVGAVFAVRHVTLVSRAMTELSLTRKRGLGANFPPPQCHPSASAFKAPSTPVVFTKPATSIVGPGERIVLPKVTQGQDVGASDIVDAADGADYEVELAVVLRSCKDVSE